MPRGKPKKEFQEYLCKATNSHVSHADYLTSPATTFLKYTIEAKSAIDLCNRKFPKKNDGTYITDSTDSLQHLTAAMLPAIMGHFETFQKSLFAGMFDYSVFLKSFKLESFIEGVNNGEIKIDIKRLSAYRNIGTSSIGNLIADSLSGWHDPEKVNKHFSAFNLRYQFYPNDDIKRLKVLWQLRHSIVHTGGTLTLPDAQKITELKGMGNINIAFENNFIYEVSRKFHPIIKKSTEGIGSRFKENLLVDLPVDVISKIDTFFKVRSPIAVWLK